MILFFIWNFNLSHLFEIRISTIKSTASYYPSKWSSPMTTHQSCNHSQLPIQVGMIHNYPFKWPSFIATHSSSHHSLTTTHPIGLPLQLPIQLAIIHNYPSKWPSVTATHPISHPSQLLSKWPSITVTHASGYHSQLFIQVAFLHNYPPKWPSFTTTDPSSQPSQPLIQVAILHICKFLSDNDMMIMKWLTDKNALSLVPSRDSCHRFLLWQTSTHLQQDLNPRIVLIQALLNDKQLCSSDKHYSRAPL